MLKKSLLSGFVATGALLAASPAFAVDAVSTEYVNMRTAPAAHASKVDVIPSGAPLKVKHCLANRPWCEVSYRGNGGWASARFIDTKNPHSIPVVRETTVRTVSPVRYETVTTPVVQKETVSYVPSVNAPYERTYVQQTTSQGTSSGLGRVVSAPFRAAAHLVSAPFTALSPATHNVTGSQITVVSQQPQVSHFTTTTQKISYPTKGKAQRIVIDQQLPPVYVKEKDLVNKSVGTVSYQQPTVTQTYVTQQPQVKKVAYIAHPTVQHVAVKEPVVVKTAYIEKAPIQKVVYRQEPVRISREVVVTPKKYHFSNENLVKSSVQHVSYRQEPKWTAAEVTKKPQIRKVVYKKTTTTTQIPVTRDYLQTVSAPAGRFNMREAEKTNVSYKTTSTAKVRAYNPAHPDAKIHNNEFHRNETRYEMLRK